MGREVGKYGLMKGTKMNVWRFTFVFGALAVSCLMGGAMIYWQQRKPERESRISRLFNFTMQKQWDTDYEERLANIRLRRTEQQLKDKELGDQ